MIYERLPARVNHRCELISNPKGVRDLSEISRFARDEFGLAAYVRCRSINRGLIQLQARVKFYHLAIFYCIISEILVNDTVITPDKN